MPGNVEKSVYNYVDNVWITVYIICDRKVFSWRYGVHLEKLH